MPATLPKKILLFLLVSFFLLPDTRASSPTHFTDSTQKHYLAALKTTGNTFISSFRPNYRQIYSMPGQEFLKKMDSGRASFLQTLNQYRNKLDPAFVHEQELEINYYFDKLLVEYPDNFETFTGKPIPDPSAIAQRLHKNLPDFNKPSYLQKPDFMGYARAFFAWQVRREVKSKKYQQTDNRYLEAIWHLIPQYVTNKTCIDFWTQDFLYYHIDNLGIKNIDEIYKNFRASCNDTGYLNKVSRLYKEDSTARQGHLVKVYKRAGAFNLDMHIFLPDSNTGIKKRPVMVYFHGGSWSEGKPDWGFYSCESYVQKGWVACAVEYRLYSRQGTLPFEAVKDARSAIRWLRQNADELGIDTSRIVVSGNSAGGHLALTCAMADKWNESTDDLHYSAIPNIVMINSGVFDLTDENNAWIRKGLKDTNLVKTISPNWLVRKGLPPMLVIHGTNDRNVPFHTAMKFEEEMMAAGNPLEFHPINNATHFIWIEPAFAAEVNDTRSKFLQKWKY